MIRKKFATISAAFAIIFVFAQPFLQPITSYGQLTYLSNIQSSNHGNQNRIVSTNRSNNSMLSISDAKVSSIGNNGTVQTNISNKSNTVTIKDTNVWIDKLSNVKIQFSHLPMYPLVGNSTELRFQVTDTKTDKPLEVRHMHISIIKNVTAGYTKSNRITTNHYFVTFDNITAASGIFSLKYQFESDGTHQIIVRLNTKDGKVALASFSVLVLIPE